MRPYLQGHRQLTNAHTTAENASFSPPAIINYLKKKKIPRKGWGCAPPLPGSLPQGIDFLFCGVLPLLAIVFIIRFCCCSPVSRICNSPASVSRVWGLSLYLASQFHLRHSIPFSLKNPIDEAMSGTWENWVENRRGDREIPVFSLKLILPAQIYLCLSVCLS